MEPQQRRPRINVHRVLKTPPGREELAGLQGVHTQSIQNPGVSRSRCLGSREQAGCFRVLTGRSRFVGGVDQGTDAWVLRCCGAHRVSEYAHNWGV